MSVDRLRLVLLLALAAFGCSSPSTQHPPVLGSEGDASLLFDAGSTPDVGTVDAPPDDGGPGVLVPASTEVPVCLTTDSSFLYYTTESGKVFKLAKNGGEPILLTTGRAFGKTILVSDGFVYWHGGDYKTGGIDRIPVGGGAAETVVASRPMSQLCHTFAVDMASVYFTDVGDTPPDGAIYRAPKNPGAQRTLLTSVRSPGDLVLDDTTIYFAEEGTPYDFDDAILRKVPKAGGKATSLTTAQTQIGGLALDPSRVFFGIIGNIMSTDLGVRSVGTNGGAVSKVWPRSSWGMALAIDGANVYVGGGGVSRFSTDGSNPKTISAIGTVISIAVDATGVYAAYYQNSNVDVAIARYAK